MPFIVVGEGQTKALLEVNKVPLDRERLLISQKMLVGGASEACELLVGSTFVFTEAGEIEVKGKGKVPWFSITNIS